MARVTSGHSVFDQARDRFIVKTGCSPVDGTKPSAMDRFRMGRSGTPDPKETFIRSPQSGLSCAEIYAVKRADRSARSYLQQCV